MFSEPGELKKAGFVGFKTVSELWNDFTLIPNEKGVYLILNPDCSKKQFLSIGSGGYFKGRNPNLPETELELNWINHCHILYIGQAGGNGSAATLRKRLKQYLDFGKGKPVGHYGGRLIWQLSHYPELLVAWKITKATDPREEEKELIGAFVDFYDKLPFANLSW
jgi:hypothetical protein